MASDRTYNPQNKRSGTPLLERLSIWLPLFFITGVVIGGIGGFLLGGAPLAAAGMSITGAPILLASLYLIIRKEVSTDLRTPHAFERLSSLRSFIILFAIGISYLFLRPDRGYEFFILLAVLYLLAYLATFSDAPERGIGYVIATLLMSIYSVTLRVPLFIGGTDILPHLSYTIHIVNTGSVIPDWVSNYANFPLYHVYAASFIQLAGRAPERSYFIIIGAVVALSPLLVYAIASRLTGERRLSSQVAVVYATLPPVVYGGQYSITRTFAFLGFLLLLWTFFAKDVNDRFRMSLVLALTVLYILLVHQVSYIQILFLLGLFWGVSLITGLEDRPIAISDLIFLVVPFAAYWVYNAERLLGQILYNQVLGLNIPLSPSEGGSALPIYHFFEYVNMYLFGLVFLSGVVISLRSNNRRLRTTALFTLICTPFILYSPIHIIDRLSVLRLDRLILFLALFTAIFVTIGFRDLGMEISMLPSSHTDFALIFLFTIFAFTGSFGGIYYDTAADSEQIGWQTPQEHLENSERAALDHTTAIPEGSHIRTSGVSYKYLSSQMTTGQFSSQQGELHNVETIRRPNDTAGEYVVRLEEREARGELLLGEFGGDYMYEGRLQLNHRNRIYSSGGGAILHEFE